MIKSYELRQALTSGKLAADVDVAVFEQVVVKNAVRLGQTLSDVEKNIIVSDLRQYLFNLKISFAEVCLILREGVNGNLSDDKYLKLTSSAVIQWFDSYFKMYAKPRAALVAEIAGAKMQKLTAGEVDGESVLKEGVLKDFDEYKKNNDFLYNRLTFKINAIAYDFLTSKNILSVSRETKQKAWKWANENAKYFEGEPEKDLIKKIIQTKFGKPENKDFLIYLAKTKLVEVFFASIEKLDLSKKYNL